MISIIDVSEYISATQNRAADVAQARLVLSEATLSEVKSGSVLI